MENSTGLRRTRRPGDSWLLRWLLQDSHEIARFCGFLVFVLVFGLAFALVRIRCCEVDCTSRDCTNIIDQSLRI